MSVKVRLVVEDEVPGRGTFDAEVITGPSVLSDPRFFATVVERLRVRVSEEMHTEAWSMYSDQDSIIGQVFSEILQDDERAERASREDSTDLYDSAKDWS
jgi:hypothetical protein